MANATYDVVVIGSGPGGYVCAIRAAQLGLSVACIEKEAAYGGTCLNVGCIPSKALLESSHLFHLSKKGFAKHGIKVKPELDLPTMLKRKDKIVMQLTRGVAGLFKKNGVVGYTGLGRFSAPGKVEVVADDGSTQTLNAGAVVIATGSSVASLPGIEIDGERIIGSTEALSLDNVPKHLAVIGAGVIGLEMGSVWARLGAKVTVLEYMPAVLAGADADVSKQVERSFRKTGLKFKLGVRVQGAERTDDGVRITYQEGDTEQTLDADVCLMSVGRKPHTDGLNAGDVGVKLDDRGRVIIDDHWRTSANGIYAIGDVVKGPMLAHKAEEEGIAVAELLAGKAGHVNYEVIPSVVYTDPEIAWVGKTEEQLKEAGREYKVGRFPFMANGRAKAMEGTDGFVKMLADLHTDRLLGVHIVGPMAGELIGEMALAMEFGASAEDVARTCHAHPSLTEVVREAALDVAGRVIHI
ncbi:MAG: dihydrolipoyl dehydrogenase [Proteobacteria bacterium]|nr:dihydrolipoyl dehydrogenase [Pseudomonadota bacterium]